MAAKVTVRDRGASALITRLRAQNANVRAVQVGIIGSDAAKEESDGITVGMVAEWAEFGIGQPMRSWLRGWVDENQSDIRDRIRAEAQRIRSGSTTRAEALARIGVWAAGQIQVRIARGIEPPNAQSTIDKKGSSTPLIDTGQLRSSVSSRLV